MKRKRRLLLLFNNKNTKGTCFLNFGAGGAIATMVGGRGPQGTVPLRMWSLREKSRNHLEAAVCLGGGPMRAHTSEPSRWFWVLESHFISCELE